MTSAKKIYESDAQGVVRVDVSVGRPGQRVEVLVVWNEVGGEGAPPRDEARSPAARRARLQRYTTWSEDDLRDFDAGLAAQRVVDAKLWA